MGIIMNVLLSVMMGLSLALVLHELTHLLVIFYYKIPFKAIVLTKWTAFGFLVENKMYVNNGRILVLLYFLPLIWCCMFFIEPTEPFLVMFPLVNIFGGLGDMYNYFKIISIPPQKRIEWANSSDEKALKSVIWMKEL
jgi:hypothetical protein